MKKLRVISAGDALRVALWQMVSNYAITPYLYVGVRKLALPVWHDVLHRSDQEFAALAWTNIYKEMERWFHQSTEPEMYRFIEAISLSYDLAIPNESRKRQQRFHRAYQAVLDQFGSASLPNSKPNGSALRSE